MKNPVFRRFRSALKLTALLASGLGVLTAAPAQAGVERITGNPNAIILDGVKVGDDMEIFFLSGQLPSPVDPAKPMSQVKSLEDMGDTKAQTISTLNKIKSLLEAQGYSMSDLVKLSLFVAADPRLGKMDFAGANEGFKQFFGTAENPNTVARSTFQVAALVGPYFLIEIEAIAVKKKAKGPTASLDIAPLEDADQPAASTSYNRPHRYPSALRKKALLAQNANGDSRRG